MAAILSGSPSDAPPPAPGSQPTTISAANLPAGARVYQYHPNTATLAMVGGEPTRVASMTAVDGVSAKTMTGASGAGAAPKLETDPVGVKRLVFEGAQWMEMTDALPFRTRECAFFIVMKPTYISQRNGLLSVGIVGAAPPTNNQIATIYSALSSQPTDNKQRALQIGQRYLMDGDDPTYSTDKDKILLGSQMQVLWGVSRNATDAMSGSGTRFVRGGVNDYGVNAITTAAQDGTANGFTFGREAINANFAKGFVYEIVLVNTYGTTPMTFAQGQAIAEEVMANWEIPTIDTNIVFTGDSRIEANSLGGSNPSYVFAPHSCYPDGPLPKNVRPVTYGSGGSNLQTAVDYRDVGLVFSTYKLQGAGKKNIVALLWNHNDMGSTADATYPGTTAGTQERADAFLAKYIAVIGTDANCFASTFDEVWAINPLASASNFLDYVRTTAPNAIMSAAFKTACENGDPSRIIRQFDVTGLTLDHQDLVAKADLSHIAYEDGVQPFGAYVNADDKRRSGTTGASYYYPPFYGDQVHPEWGGAPYFGRALGDFYNATR